MDLLGGRREYEDGRCWLRLRVVETAISGRRISVEAHQRRGGPFKRPGSRAQIIRTLLRLYPHALDAVAPGVDAHTSLAGDG